MELQHLKYFLTVAKEENLTKASKKLNTVQSNTTAKLKALEEELGHALFIRSKKGMFLTERGKSLVIKAKEMLELEKNIYREMENEVIPLGLLSVGCLDSFVRLYLGNTITDFVKKYPDVDLEIQTGFNSLLLKKLYDSEIDLAGIVGEVSSSFEVVYQKKEKMVLLSHNKVLDNLPVLILGKDCFFGQTLQDYFNHSRKVLNIASIESILTCVNSGMGISLLPKSIVPSRYKHLIQKQLKQSCTYSLVRKKERVWNSAETAFVDTLLNRRN